MSPAEERLPHEVDDFWGCAWCWYLSRKGQQHIHCLHRAGRGANGNQVSLKRQRTGNRFVDNTSGLVMMAVCEVVNDASRLKKVHNGGIWVATSEELVSTRFFLVFSGVPQASVSISDSLEKDQRTPK